MPILFHCIIGEHRRGERWRRQRWQQARRRKSIQISDAYSDSTQKSCQCQLLRKQRRELKGISRRLGTTQLLKSKNFQGARIVKASHFELDYMLGRKITFFCMATGFPRPEITWLKDGIELYHHKFFQVLVMKFLRAKLKKKKKNCKMFCKCL